MPRDPRSDTSFAFERLTADEWEELTFLLARREDNRVIRVQAPDGGFDTVLPDPGAPDRAQRGWQAKHFTKRIHWKQCQDSLDDAVKNWGARRVTFVFPINLSQPALRTFREKLVDRHAGVSVDHVGADGVAAMLLADDQGERIAKRYFGESDPVAVMERAMRAGGELSRPEHVLDREAAISEFTDADPTFTWVVHKLPEDAPDLSATPGSAMRLTFGRDGWRLIADALPRSAGSLGDLGPSVRLLLDGSREAEQINHWLGELREHGGRLRLREGVRVAISGLPSPFGELVPDELHGEVLLRTTSPGSPFYARVCVTGDRGDAEMEIDLHPVDPGPDYDTALEGQRGGLTVRIESRWEVDQGRGETHIAWRYRPGRHPAPLADRAAAARMMVAVHGQGTLTFRDRARNDQIRIEDTLTRREVPANVAELAVLLDSLEEIERFTGRPAPEIPEQVELADIDKLGEVAELLCAGGDLVRTRMARMTVTSATAPDFGSVVPDLVVLGRITVEVFGTTHDIAKSETRFPPMSVLAVERIAGQDDVWEVKLVPLASSQIEVWTAFEPLAEAE